MPGEVVNSVSEGRPEESPPTANQRFKDSYRLIIAVGVLVSIAFHFAAFEFFPKMQAANLDFVPEELSAVELPPEVRIPPPPEAIMRPARPILSDRPIDEDITIAPSTFEDNPVSELAPPPPNVEVDPSDQPVYIARDVDPRLTNAPEMLRLLDRLYPKALKEAGIGGEVTMWVWVDEQGRPGRAVINRSSGYPQLDATALAIAAEMKFTPAMLRDKPVGVWVAQPVSFSVGR
ncbi:MAG: energy transducer TonB [Candidatus Palauibacterales bacterium]|jgi:periplasmic protein TonB|nr:energy transducer TonB [Candidatus Palauibacterales bacterium]MDP2482067.1 energy transducer TonB [Candidatus Palauibacterales bacterium]